MYIPTYVHCRIENYVFIRAAVHPGIQDVLSACSSPLVCHAPAGDEELWWGRGYQEGPNGPNPLTVAGQHFWLGKKSHALTLGMWELSSWCHEIQLLIM